MSTNPPIRVLVVDDDDEIFELIGALLFRSSRADYKLEYLANVHSVKPRMEQGGIDIVLVDQNLGQSLTGLEIIKQCASLRVPMVLVTSEDHDQLDFAALNVGAAGFILKQDLSTSVLDRTIRYGLARYGQIRSLEDETATHRKMAFTDALTGLPNRREFDVRFNLAVADADSESREFGILYIDLNGFKQVNDTHGHEAGDLVLQVVAARLLGEFRDHDAICRIGGDEFVAIIRRYTEAGSLDKLMTALEQRLKARVAEAMIVNDVELEVSASIGSAIYPRDGKNSAELMKTADKHMFDEKRQSCS